MYEYSRQVFYYETDRMGVVHHTNFIRWMEEARIACFTEAGVPYADMEAGGVYNPIIDINVRYKHFARFGDIFTVRLEMTKYTGARFEINYVIVNQNGDELLEGKSLHAFISASGYRPVSLAKALPETHELIKEYMRRNGNGI